MAGPPPRRPGNPPRASWQPNQAEPAPPQKAAPPVAPPPSSRGPSRQSYEPAARAPAPPSGPPGGIVGPPSTFGSPSSNVKPPTLEHQPLSDKDLAGPSTGRGLGRAKPPVAVASGEARPDQPGELSPFQRYAPGSAQLDAAGSRSDSTQVIAIVGGLAFMMTAAIAIVAIIGVLGWYTVGNMIEDGRLAGIGNGLDDEDPGHIRDTAAVPGRIIEKPRPGGGGGKKPGGGEPAPEPVPTGPSTGPGTIIMAQQGVLFHSIEVNCARSGIRARANFRDGRATAQGLSTGEECTVTFQGSQPARTTLRGGQTKTCTSINPTVCR